MKTSFQIFKDFFSFVGWLAPAKGIDEVNSDMIPTGFVIDEINSDMIPTGFVIDEVISNVIVI